MKKAMQMTMVQFQKNFIEQMIDKDLLKAFIIQYIPDFHRTKWISAYWTCKIILLNYGLAQKYGGQFNMRFDDTNPTKEKIEFVESIRTYSGLEQIGRQALFCIRLF